MDNKIKIENGYLIIEPQGIDKILGFKNKFEIPINHVMGATIDRDILQTKKGFRIPGTELPNKWVGTWQLNHEKSFWNVTRAEIPVVIQLKNEKFSRLILGIDDASGWVDRIDNSVSAKVYGNN